MHSLLKSVEDRLNKLESIKHVVIAFSGGVDSHVLLHICSQLKTNFKAIHFQAIHINHGLQQKSKEWSAHCEKVSSQLKVGFLSIEVDAVNKGDGPEQTARKARYKALLEHTSKQTLVFTAQHQDDQAETLLLQLLRGCGVQGLASMPALDDFGLGFIARPFLQQSQQSIIDYARQNDLSWIDDPSNQDISLDRNYLRHEVIPLIKERWPAFSSTTSRTAKLCAETNDVLEAVAENYLSQHDEKTLEIGKIESLAGNFQRIILRHWLRQNNIQNPSLKIILEIQKGVIAADIDKTPLVQWADTQIRRYNNKLYLLGILKQPSVGIINFIDGEYKLPQSLGNLKVTKSQGKGIKAFNWEQGEPEVRFRCGGERIKLSGREGTKKLKSLLHENKVLPWVRDSLPLIFIDNELVAIADLWIAEAFLAADNEAGYCLDWDHPKLAIF